MNVNKITNDQALKNDLFAMFEDYCDLEFSKWVNAVEAHVDTLKTKLCKSCGKPELEVVELHKAKCNNCNILNSF